MLTVGEMRERIASVPDSYTIYVTRGPKGRHYGEETIVHNVLCGFDGASAVFLEAETTFPERTPDDIINVLEDEVDQLKDCLSKIKKHFKELLNVETPDPTAAALYDQIKFYLD
jgi:hypothetical protein